FILLTLIFPIIGGICLSKGVSAFHNFKEKRIAEKKLKKLEADYRDHKNNDLLNALKKMRRIEALIDKIKNPEFKKTASNDILASYQRGFHKGLGGSLQHMDDDLYLLAKEHRAKLAKRRIFESIGGGRPPGGPAGDGNGQDS